MQFNESKLSKYNELVAKTSQMKVIFFLHSHIPIVVRLILYEASEIVP